MSKQNVLLNFAGDVVLGDLFETYKSGIGSGIAEKSLDPFLFCREYLKQGDLNIINLESVLSDVSSRKSPWSAIMRGGTSSVDILKKNSIHAVNLANNHSFDHGHEAFSEMLNLLDKSGIKHFGGPRDKFQEEPARAEVRGKKILFLGYYIEESLSILDREQLIDRINRTALKVRREDEVLVLSLHWGSEYSDKPFSWMISAAKRFMDSGVDILYGHHSHTYQGVAKYKNAIFAPSLGNFIFQDYFKKNLRSALLQVELSEKSPVFNTIPIVIDNKGRPNYSKHVEKSIASLNENLARILSKTDDELSLWDKDAAKQVRSGHFKNRLKIKCKILTNPVKYYPFIFSKNGN